MVKAKGLRTEAPLAYVLEFQGSGARNSSIHGQGERRAVALLPSGPHRIRRCPPTLVRADLLTQSTDSNANLLQEFPCRFPQNE